MHGFANSMAIKMLQTNAKAAEKAAVLSVKARKM